MENNISKLSDIILNSSIKAAISCYDWIGKGDNMAADAAAVKAMRSELNKAAIKGTIVIGEGERDQAPMLYIGEEVGIGGQEIDIALDPLEGTSICANAREGSLAVIAFAKKNCFLNAPDVYMDKIAIGINCKEQLIDLDNSPAENLKNLALFKKCQISDLTTLILKRSRHEELIAKVREAGSKVKLIDDGDVAGVIACTNNIDIYMGIGGAPEGVLAAAALKTIGGQMMGRLIFNDNIEQINRAKKMGISNLSKKYLINDMAKGDVLFACSGVTSGDLLNGINKNNNIITTQSIIMDSSQKRTDKITSKFII
ncbi:class II fructose-bisphosphatase [Rickettsiales bacterium]|nr:class II fructose-bisphosphatase [Rickettsiales bacterium]